MRFRLIILTIVVLCCASAALAQDAYVSNNVIVFPSIASYDGYAGGAVDRSSLTTLARESSLPTLSQREGFDVDDENNPYPEFLGQVLNQDLIMQISRFYVKVDLYNGRALAIDVSQPNAYQTLVNDDFSAPGVIYFGSEEDMALETLEMIENGGFIPMNKRGSLHVTPEGRCAGAPRRTCKGFNVWDQVPNGSGTPGCIYDTYGMDYKVVYQKAIFYFSLESKAKSLKACESTNWILVPSYDAALELQGTARYRKRCGPEVVKTKLDHTVDRKITWRPYEDSRSLSSYDFGVTFGIAHPTTGTPNYKHSSCAIQYGITPATHAGMTWTVLGRQTGLVHVGSDAQTNPYNGDTAATVSLPVLCLFVDNSPVPPGLATNFYNGWARGRLAVTAPIAGSQLTSRIFADALCTQTFGPNWRMAEFHDGGGGWSYWGYGSIGNGRFWTAINDQPANPWN